ncbi:MAG: hypothetical protein ACK528_02715 [Alphaproteobacteria bacterium]|jgi:hypothetical protein
MARRKKRKKFNRWWVPYTAHSDQEIERGLWIYDAILEGSKINDQMCFNTLLKARDYCMDLCQKLDRKGDEEKWLFYSAVFLGVGMMIRERIKIYEEVAGD